MIIYECDSLSFHIISDSLKQDQSPLAARNLTLQLQVLDASGQLLFQGQ